MFDHVAPNGVSGVPLGKPPCLGAPAFDPALPFVLTWANTNAPAVLSGEARAVGLARFASLPDAMQGQLFDSLVSVRGSGARAGAPHLGLGLYVVRLVAELHQGKVSARNDTDGATFEMDLRGMRRPESE